MTPRNVLLASALKYATVLHWPVFPLKPRTKEPATAHGFKDATTDPEQIRRWWKQHPDYNIGTPTGLIFFTLDVDPRHGGDQTLESLILKHGKLSDTIQQMTGGGGRHYCFAAPDQMMIRCGNLAPGLDIKATDGYIVVAPSIHPDTGQPYVWDGALDLADQPILPAPGWLLDLIDNSQRNHHNGIPFETPPKIPKGKQHFTLVSIAGSMRARGLGFDEIFAALKIVNDQRCEEPGPIENIRKIVESICRYPPGSMNGDDPGRAPDDRREYGRSAPHILTCGELLTIETTPTKMIFDGCPIPAHGLSLMVGAAKEGKTLLAVQQAVAVVTGRHLFDNYTVLESGPVLIVERDDPAGAAALKPMVQLSGCTAETLLYVASESPIGFGPALLEWLEEQITQLAVKFVVLDSYTALRGTRGAGADIVKLEAAELAHLDQLGKHLRCALVLIHHGSKTAAGLDWTLSAAGTYAMFAASECLIHVSRFADLDAGAPERLVRIRGRRAGDLQLVLRFDREILGYRHVLEGAAAPLFPLLKQIQTEFGDQTFSIKELTHRTGLSRAHGYRQINRLVQGNAVMKRDMGYALAFQI
jgi:hypothetical protein